MSFTKNVTNTFKENKWRMTAGVRNMLVVLEDSSSLLTIGEIHDHLKAINREIDITTIYRILEKIESIGLVHSTSGKWMKCSDPDNKDEHHFLICDKCGKSEEIFLDYKRAIAMQLKKEKKLQSKGC